LKATPRGQVTKWRRSRHAAGSSSRGSSKPGAGRDGHRRQQREGCEQQCREQVLRAGFTEGHREGAAADQPVVRDVAVVVDGQRCRRQPPMATEASTVTGADAAGQHPVGAHHGHQAEEHEDRQLAEGRVGDGRGPPM
jgi:hypothetical protein